MSVYTWNSEGCETHAFGRGKIPKSQFTMFLDCWGQSGRRRTKPRNQTVLMIWEVGPKNLSSSVPLMLSWPPSPPLCLSVSLPGSSRLQLVVSMCCLLCENSL